MYSQNPGGGHFTFALQSEDFFNSSNALVETEQLGDVTVVEQQSAISFH
jgi:hypothetical protein